ncbi:MAG: CrcB family protein [Phascolarctobacterium sp.]|nr:CrcB family protein [Phascolarctobacterium sp.]
MQKVLLVGLGGAIGAMLRYLLYLATAKFYQHAFITTFIINLTGCFIMGIVMTLIFREGMF